MFSRDAVCEEAWYRGRQHLAILSSAQKRIYAKFEEDKNSTFVVECSRQLGKTYWACFLADKVARENPGCQIRLGTAFQVDIESIIVPNFKNVLRTCPEKLKPVYKAAKATYNYANGSQVVLVGLDKNPDKLRGNRIRLVIIEEAGFVDSETLQYVLDSVVAGAQLREPDARTVLISTPPKEGQDHHFCDVADQMELVGSYIKITIDESGLPQESIDHFAETLGGRHTVAFRREALCERIVDTERALCAEWKAEYEVEPIKDSYYPLYHKLVGMDLGRKDKTLLVFGYYDFKRATLFLEDEISLTGPDWTTLTLKDVVLKKEAELWGEQRPFRRISDNNNPHLIIDLGSIHNVHFSETDKESLEAMVNQVREWVKSGRIKVSPNCKQLIGCLKYGLWDKNRKEFARSKAYGHADAFAALMYLVRNTPVHSNPIPAEFGFVNHKAWLGNIKDKRNHTPNAMAIGEALFPRLKRKT